MTSKLLFLALMIASLPGIALADDTASLIGNYSVTAISCASAPVNDADAANLAKSMSLSFAANGSVTVKTQLSDKCSSTNPGLYRVQRNLLGIQLSDGTLAGDCADQDAGAAEDPTTFFFTQQGNALSLYERESSDDICANGQIVIVDLQKQ